LILLKSIIITRFSQKSILPPDIDLTNAAIWTPNNKNILAAVHHVKNLKNALQGSK
jgi:hypothetical protein